MFTGQQSNKGEFFMFAKQLRVAAYIFALCMGAASLAAEASTWAKEVYEVRKTDFFHDRAFSIPLRHAQSGNVHAQAYLARVHFEGTDRVDKDVNKAWRWYRRIAEETDASTLLDLGYSSFGVQNGWRNSVLRVRQSCSNRMVNVSS